MNAMTCIELTLMTVVTVVPLLLDVKEQRAHRAKLKAAGNWPLPRKPHPWEKL